MRKTIFLKKCFYKQLCVAEKTFILAWVSRDLLKSIQAKLIYTDTDTFAKKGWESYLEDCRFVSRLATERHGWIFEGLIEDKSVMGGNRWISQFPEAFCQLHCKNKSNKIYCDGDLTSMFK